MPLSTPVLELMYDFPHTAFIAALIYYLYET
jgi:hypothetical protein